MIVDAHELGMLCGLIGTVRWAMKKPFNWIDISALAMGAMLFFI